MTRLLVAGFLIAHGWIHPALWVLPPDDDKEMPFDPHSSWALSVAHVAVAPARTLSMGLAWLTAILLGVSGVALLFDAGFWVEIAAAGAVVGLLFKTAYFHPWLTIGVALDAAILWAMSTGWPPSLF